MLRLNDDGDYDGDEGDAERDARTLLGCCLNAKLPDLFLCGEQLKSRCSVPNFVFGSTTQFC